MKAPKTRIVKVRMITGEPGAVNVSKPDDDGDVHLNTDAWGWYYDVPSVRRLIKALEWAIRPRRKSGGPK